MITLDNLQQFLHLSGFIPQGELWIKHYVPHDCSVKVDFNQQKILYPNGLIVWEEQTCNFHSNENFVVLDCVNRLLDKGYKPVHLELEPRWQFGHDAKSARADLLVKDHSDKLLLLIECKTWGKEFTKAWKDTLADGAQLFSYAQQIPAVKYLCLYASSLEQEQLIYDSHIIVHQDNEEYLKSNRELESFASGSKDNKQRFAVWRDTYQQEFLTSGIFEDNIQAYHIGKDKYTIDDLAIISQSVEQKQYHNFATILR